MIPQDFIGANSVAARPFEMKEEECADLPIFKGVDANSHPVILSAWKPTEEELTLLNKGEPVYVTILGYSMPPIYLTSITPFIPICSGEVKEGEVE